VNCRPLHIDGKRIDGTSDTEGIELALGSSGPDYPKGLLVAEDGDNAPDT
jgi:3-phytase